jgi:Asp/Glu/hydantoin racemase
MTGTRKGTRKSVERTIATNETKRTRFLKVCCAHDEYEQVRQRAMQAALRVAAAKYGNQITITGTAEFRERAARMAANLGLGVQDGDLQGIVQNERERFQQRTRQSRSERLER